MQIENEHVEKIFDTTASYDTRGVNDEVLKYMDIEDFKLAVSKILALGKPEPLAKNKQFDKSCISDGEFTSIDFKQPFCKDCGHRCK